MNKITETYKSHQRTSFCDTQYRENDVVLRMFNLKILEMAVIYRVNKRCTSCNKTSSCILFVMSLISSHQLIGLL